MATTEEAITRVYTIYLCKSLITPDHMRTDRVVNMIREFDQKHMKSSQIKLDQDLNRQVWSRGKTNPPRKVRVKMVKEEDGTVTVSLYEDLPAATTSAIETHTPEENKDSENKNSVETTTTTTTTEQSSEEQTTKAARK